MAKVLNVNRQTREDSEQDVVEILSHEGDREKLTMLIGLDRREWNGLRYVVALVTRDAGLTEEGSSY